MNDCRCSEASMQFPSNRCNYAVLYNAAEVGILFAAAICQPEYRPILVAILNIVLSIILGRLWGVFGVLFATFLSRAAISLWYDPLILHRYGFEVSCKPFFARYFRRVLLLTAVLIAMLTIPNNVTSAIKLNPYNQKFRNSTFLNSA